MHYLVQHYFHLSLFLSNFSKIFEFLVGSIPLDSQSKQQVLMSGAPRFIDTLASDISPRCLDPTVTPHGHKQGEAFWETQKGRKPAVIFKKSLH